MGSPIWMYINRIHCSASYTKIWINKYVLSLCRVKGISKRNSMGYALKNFVYGSMSYRKCTLLLSSFCSFWQNRVFLRDAERHWDMTEWQYSRMDWLKIIKLMVDLFISEFTQFLTTFLLKNLCLGRQKVRMRKPWQISWTLSTF